MELKKIIYDEEFETECELDSEAEIENLTRNFESIGENTLFFLLKSIKSYAEFIINDIKKARVIVTERQFLEDASDACVLYVKNVRKTMAFAYSRFSKIDYAKTKFIAVTGTNGKTTTATLIKNVLSEEGERVGFIGTGKIELMGKLLNEEFYSMTTPDPEILYPSIKKMQDQGCSYIIMEASSHALYFDKLAPIPFEIGIFTNLSSEHLDFHKNIEAYYECKLKLFENCKKGIFNCDDRYSRRARAELDCESETVGILWPADAMAREIHQNELWETEYIYRERSLIFKLKTKLVGAYNIYNSLLAVKALLTLGIKACRIKRAFEKIRGIDGRFEIIAGKLTVVRDYAHTPNALENLLKTLKSFKKPRQNIILVFGCGGERDKTKRPVMAEIAEKHASFSIVTSDNPRNESETDIIEDILSGFTETTKRTVITDRKRAIEHAILNSCDGDVVVIAGKGAENYIIDKDGYHYFSEKEIIEEALKKRDSKEV